MGDITDSGSDNPWTSPAARKIQSRGGYQEPSIDDEGDITIAPISYPPPSQNPFNQSRPSVQQFASAASPTTSTRSPIDVDDNSTTSPFQDADRAASPIAQGRPKYDITPTSLAFSETVQNGQRVVLGVAVVDFNHLVGPTVEWSYPESLTRALERDQELTRLLPFLALPDGAHLVSTVVNSVTDQLIERIFAERRRLFLLCKNMHLAHNNPTQLI
jgi:hypothetical protein